MRKILVFAMLVFLLPLSSVLAEKEMRVPFRSSPAGIRYVPNEFVVEFKSEVKQVSPRLVDGVVRIGIPDFDALNQTYRVDRMRAQFPGARAGLKGPDLSGYFVLRFDPSFQLKDVLDAYSKLPFVDHVEPIGIHPVYASYPNDTYFDPEGHPTFPYYQWYHDIASDHDMDSPEGWDIERGDSTLILAILDTGVRYFHKDLGGPNASYSDPRNCTNGNIWINWAEYNGTDGVDDDNNGYVDDWVGWDWVNVSPSFSCSGEDYYTEDNDPRDFNGHGTHVAGLASAITNNVRGVAGFAGGWGDGTTSSHGNGVKIMCLRIGWSECWPVWGEIGYVRMDFAASALYYAANNGAKVVNASWGSSNTGGLADAVDYFLAQGGFIAHAAGNDNADSPDYLASRTEVLTVAATDSFDVKASFSNYGTWVDVSAPGEDIISLFHNHDDPQYDYVAVVSGTSQSSPLAAGLAALLWCQNPGWSRQQVFDRIVSTTDNIDAYNPGYEGLLGSGRINAYKALQTAPDTIPPEVTVTDPNGGEVLTVGEVYTITWNATDNVGVTQTSIYYSYDGGAGYEFIDSLSGNPGSYDWTVPNTPSTQCLVKVYAYDAAGNSGSDVSDDFFTIQSPPPGPTLYVASIVMSTSTDKRNRTYAIAKMTVKDDQGKVVPGATVYSHWEGLTSDSDVKRTNKKGVAAVKSDKVRNACGDFIIKVDDVVKNGYAYDPGMGVDSNSIYYCGGSKLVSAGAPEGFALHQNHPNPFNPDTYISFSLPERSHVLLVIYNILGKRIRTLVKEEMEAGTHSIHWDGKDDVGNQVASGIYFYRLRTEGFDKTRKMVIMK